ESAALRSTAKPSPPLLLRLFPRRCPCVTSVFRLRPASSSRDSETPSRTVPGSNRSSDTTCRARPHTAIRCPPLTELRPHSGSAASIPVRARAEQGTPAPPHHFPSAAARFLPLPGSG